MITGVDAAVPIHFVTARFELDHRISSDRVPIHLLIGIWRLIDVQMDVIDLQTESLLCSSHLKLI